MKNGEAGQPPDGSDFHLGVRSIDEATDMDVIVIEQRTGIDAAAWGGVLSEAAHHKHIRGVIVEGAARDIDEINETGLPVFSRTTTPVSARGRIHEAGRQRADHRLVMSTSSPVTWSSRTALALSS